MATPLSSGMGSLKDRTPRIAIVGAGLAGLAAALALQDAGFSCQIYEASSRLGGRIHSQSNIWMQGLVSEWCGEFIDREHQALWRLIRRFGLETIDLGKHVPTSARSLIYFSRHLQDPDDLAQELQRLAPVLHQQFQDVGFPTTYQHFTEAGARLDSLSVYQWIERFVEGGHGSLLGKVLNGGCRGFYGVETTGQSALNLVYLFGALAGAPSYTGRPFMAGPAQTSYKIVQGNQRLIQAIATALPVSSIHLDHRLTAIERDDTETITLSLTTQGGQQTVVADHVILAQPFSTLRLLDYQRAGFDALKQTAITQLLYGSISKLFLEFDTPYWYQKGPWPQEHSGFILTDLEIQTLWDGSLGQAASGGLLVNYTSGSRGAAYAPPSAYTTTADAEILQEYASQALQQLEEIFPGISAHYTGHAALSYPTGDPYARGSYACWGVGQYTLFAGYEGIRQGPIHFAGEHCSVDWQGFMEGAAAEGVRAAHEVIQDLQS